MENEKKFLIDIYVWKVDIVYHDDQGETCAICAMPEAANADDALRQVKKKYIETKDRWEGVSIVRSVMIKQLPIDDRDTEEISSTESQEADA